MRTYNQIHFTKVASILTLVAQGVSCVTGFDYPVSDMIHSLEDLSGKMHSWSDKTPYYIAIREQGTESGRLENCIERCEMLGYPIVIAKIEADKVCDYNMTIKFTQNWKCGDINQMKEEFNSL